jgi:hypothetical protein
LIPDKYVNEPTEDDTEIGGRRDRNAYKPVAEVHVVWFEITKQARSVDWMVMAMVRNFDCLYHHEIHCHLMYDHYHL